MEFQMEVKKRHECNNKNKSNLSRFYALQLEGNDEKFGLWLTAGDQNDPYAKITKITAGSPADRSGLKKGMRISRINGFSTFEINNDKLFTLLNESLTKRYLQLILAPYYEDDLTSYEESSSSTRNCSISSIRNQNPNSDLKCKISYPTMADTLHMDSKESFIANNYHSNCNGDNYLNKIIPESYPLSLSRRHADSSISEQTLEQSLSLSTRTLDGLDIFRMFCAVAEKLVNLVETRSELEKLRYLSDVLECVSFKNVIRYFQLLLNFTKQNVTIYSSNRCLSLPSPQVDQKMIDDLRIKFEIDSKIHDPDAATKNNNDYDKTIDKITESYTKAIDACRTIRKRLSTWNDLVGEKGSMEANEKHYAFPIDMSNNLLSRNGSPMPCASDLFQATEKPTMALPICHNKEKDRVKLIRMEVNDQPIGITMVNQNDSVVVSRVIKNSVADFSGLIKKGDEILEINNVAVKGMDVETIAKIVKDLDSRTVTFLIVPAENSIFGFNHQSPPENESIWNNDNTKSTLANRQQLNGKQDINQKSKIILPDTFSNSINASITAAPFQYLKALFNYNPEEDTYSPCNDLGLRFRIGDILEILDRDDKNYWQARKVKREKLYHTFETEPTVGIIPSKIFYQHCAAINHALLVNQAQEDAAQSCFSCISCVDSRKVVETDFESQQLYVHPYQEMKLIPSDPFRRRPLIILSKRTEQLTEIFERMEVEMPAYCVFYRIPTSVINMDVANADALAAKITEISNSGKVCMIIMDDKHARTISKFSIQPFIVLMMEPLMRFSGRFKWEKWDTSKATRSKYPSDLVHAVPYSDVIITWTKTQKLMDDFKNILTMLLNNPQWVTAN